MNSDRPILTSGFSRKVALLLASVLLMALAYVAARYWQTASDNFARQTLSADCDLRVGPCRHVMSEGVVSFAIAPRSIPLMQPLRLELGVEGLDVIEALVEIRGLNMDMGLNRTRLDRLADGRWVGETILPVCSQRTMRWEAAVRLVGNRRVEVAFPFVTVRR